MRSPAPLCIAEKLAYPWASDPERADMFDRLAKEHKVSILGTGINPGFMLDALIVMWSSICMRVDAIEASRVNDLSPFGPTVMTGQGVGTTVEQFEKGVADGSIGQEIAYGNEPVRVERNRFELEVVRKEMRSAVYAEVPLILQRRTDDERGGSSAGNEKVGQP